MVSEIRIYVEGGGEQASAKAHIRMGFHQFLRDLNTLARSKRIRWAIVACGSRTSTFADFMNALKSHPDAFNVLLVDSEGPVDPQYLPWAHLAQRDSWRKPTGCVDDQCQLMVQTMEHWLIVDREALKRFYGQGFHENSLPSAPDVEQIDRHLLMSNREAATRGTQKGVYHKIQHGSQLLEQIDPAKVRDAAPHCRRLFTILTDKMSEP